MNDYPYTIPEDATLIKQGLYYKETVVGTLGTLRELFAEYGWAIYPLDVPEDQRFYSYTVSLAINDSIDNYDVCEITEDMDVAR